jgi:hypothetical protein
MGAGREGGRAKGDLEQVRVFYVFDIVEKTHETSQVGTIILEQHVSVGLKCIYLNLDIGRKEEFVLTQKRM